MHEVTGSSPVSPSFVPAGRTAAHYLWVLHTRAPTGVISSIDRTGARCMVNAASQPLVAWDPLHGQGVAQENGMDANHCSQIVHFPRITTAIGPDRLRADARGLSLNGLLAHLDNVGAVPGLRTLDGWLRRLRIMGDELRPFVR